MSKYEVHSFEGGDDYGIAVVSYPEADLPVYVALFADGLDDEDVVNNTEGQWISLDAAAEVGAALLAMSGGSATATPAAHHDDVNRSILEVAEQHGLTIEFGYATEKFKGLIQHRTVKVEEIVEARSGTLIVGHDLERDDTRAFRLDRVVGQVRVK